MSLASRIKHRRLELGMTQDELAKKAGVSEATIARYESGVIKNPRQPVLVRLLDALNVEPNFLMGWDDHVPPAPPPISKQRQVAFDRIANASDEQINQLNDLLDLIWKDTEQ